MFPATSGETEQAESRRESLHQLPAESLTVAATYASNLAIAFAAVAFRPDLPEPAPVYACASCACRASVTPRINIYPLIGICAADSTDS